MWLKQRVRGKMGWKGLTQQDLMNCDFLGPGIMPWAGEPGAFHAITVSIMVT